MSLLCGEIIAMRTKLNPSKLTLIAFASLALLLTACSGEAGEIKDLYKRFDFNMNTDNAAKIDPMLTEDFALTTDGDPEKTFIYEGQGGFQKRGERLEAENAHMFTDRLRGAAKGGDQFATTVDKVTVNGDKATAEITRVQKRTLGANAKLTLTYTCTDEWVRDGDSWKLAAEKVKTSTVSQ